MLRKFSKEYEKVCDCALAEEGVGVVAVVVLEVVDTLAVVDEAVVVVVLTVDRVVSDAVVVGSDLVVGAGLVLLLVGGMDRSAFVNVAPLLGVMDLSALV